MKIFRFVAVPFLLMALQTAGQPVAGNKSLSRPKLVVGMMVDQMRWDYLYRYYDRYTNDGFRRLLREGFSCENTLINYAPTVTACGHTSVYTGSVPAVHGIIGNAWYDTRLGRSLYCTEDTAVQTVGSYSDAGKMSPRNLLVTTVTDELRLATNFRSKVIGIAIKDRGAILPVGHTANAAFWYDGATGNWISSTYYMKELPEWVRKFNDQKLVDQYFRQDWKTLYPLSTYVQSTEDEKAYEGKFRNSSAAFPHPLSDLAGKSYNLLPATPDGNTLTFAFAKAALESNQLGKSGVTDFLAISLSSPDYVGHQYGPNSVEVEDLYLRLDRELAAFLQFLDAKIGKGQYLFFLTADHGVAHVPGFMEEHRLPAGVINEPALQRNLSQAAEEQFGIKNVILQLSNYQLYLNHSAIDQAGKDEEKVKAFLIAKAKKMQGIANALDLEKLEETALPAPLHTLFLNGYHAKRAGDIQLILEPGWIEGGKTGTTHGLWYPYDAHIPLIWMGWQVKPGATHAEVHMTDIAPTLAAFLHIQMPSGNIGKVILPLMH